MQTVAISCKDVTLKDGFWNDRRKINKEVTVDAVFNRFDSMGKIDAFWCTWRPDDGDEKKPHRFWDSDVAKWIEGVAYILMHEPMPEEEKKIDHMIDGIETHMTSDGYFNVHFNILGLASRFTSRDSHELYCAGHHMEAACAYYDATGKDKYLKLMMRFADLIYKIFVEEDSAYFVTPGHPEIELALIKLYRTTGNGKYLDLCKFFIDKRGNNEKDTPMFGDPLYAYDQIPLRRAEFAEGHCVRTNYLMSGVCDLAYETGDTELYEACKRVLSNIENKRMYITGGQGSTFVGERYTTDYDLPNKSAYTETCASISLGMYAHRMSLVDADSRYDDIVERTLYNGTLSGVSLDGDSFFYENPLEYRDVDFAVNYYDFPYGRKQIAPRVRQKMFGCSCCPPNIVRHLASIGGYIYSYSESDDILFVHQYIPSVYDNGKLSVDISTAFPMDGKIDIKISGVKKLAVRIPYYCKNPITSAAYEMKNGYAYFDISDETVISLDLGLKARFVYSNTRVLDNIGRAAVMYGPLVYCAESVDNNGSVHNFFADTDANIEISGDFHGAPVLSVKGVKQESSSELYSDEPPKKISASLNLIPYFAFSNRGECEMLTYIPVN